MCVHGSPQEGNWTPILHDTMFSQGANSPFEGRPIGRGGYKRRFRCVWKTQVSDWQEWGVSSGYLSYAYPL
jgi:hypothetical protein